TDYDEASDSWLHERTFGSSEYARTILNRLWGTPPNIAVSYDARVHRVLGTLAESGLISSASDVGDGGLAVALAEASFRAGLGMRVDLERLGLNASTTVQLFGETACRLLLTCPRTALSQVESIVSESRLAGLKNIGSVTGNSLEILSYGSKLISSTIADLKQPWSSALESHLHDQTAAEVLA
ncbi:MAG TPA: AIR synthase-related protein, partial [Acidobacteriaceae bacterium]|nr:AIR synthase-related protein [Acidobacteriaceae bacterium]